MAPPEGVETLRVLVLLGESGREGGEAVRKGEEGPALFVEARHAGDGQETEAVFTKRLFGWGKGGADVRGRREEGRERVRVEGAV